MFASEPIPFDPMEVALHEAYARNMSLDERKQYQLRYEYPLEGKPPMMTHVFEKEMGNRIIAAKGAPEALMQVCHLSEAEKKEVEEAVISFGQRRVQSTGRWGDSLGRNPFPGYPTRTDI